jgi:ribose/xylose/arabinose/galactoside ABC-type transport system permease subunit
VELSKGVPEAKTLSERLAKFVDKEAHWAAALYSTQAVDILMRKPIFAFVQMAAVAVLIFVGFLLTLSPLKMERVRILLSLSYLSCCRFHSLLAQTFPPTIQRNTTVTEKIERYNTSSVICWVAACFLLLSFCFAWLRSPRSGRVVFALGVLAVFLSQGLVYIVWDPYNSDLYV